jgi:hypothetical protein
MTVEKICASLVGPRAAVMGAEPIFRSQIDKAKSCLPGSILGVGREGVIPYW